MIFLHKKWRLILALAMIVVGGQNASALPSHKRLWEGKYGYKVSCALCHSKGGGSQLNSYGEDFQRFGMTPAAFASIESRDSDKDGATNIEEIRAKSNPGDTLSTPSAPTVWLSRIEDSMIPMEELKKIFPSQSKFSVLEGTLFPNQVKDVEARLKGKVLETDSVPTFYFAVSDAGNGKMERKGVALFSTPRRSPEKLIVGVGIDLSGKITNVILIKNKFDALLSKNSFLNQFKGKSVASDLTIGKDIQPASSSMTSESEEVAEAVKKSLLVVSAVFNKK